VDGIPCLAGGIDHNARLDLRPLAGTLMVRVGPGKDLLLCQAREVRLVPSAPVLG